MTKIILASASVQRKKLLQIAGIKFRVRPSRVHEVKKIKTTCEELVKHNALLKAIDVAGRLKDGLVIGADTVVSDGKKHLIGKPRDFKDAERILKLLFSRPHWVYTGVAVVDARTKRRSVDYEKTKVFMHKLSLKEIKTYHRHTTPLDKAGGFDIEGRGGLFIRRIEGCYSNVIGLPMAKLRLMLKKFGINLLSLLVIVSAIGISGCTTEYNLATKQEETLLYGTEKEIKIGDSIARQIEQNFKLNTDLDLNERLQRILDKIVEVCDRKDLVYSIRILEEEEINAVSLPGGRIYVFKGIIDHMKSDDELAGVIAHEIGHLTAKHAMKRLQASYSYLLLQVLAVQSGDAALAQGVGAIYTMVFLGYSREDEFEADRLAVKYTQMAGYDPKAMLAVLDEIRKDASKKPLREISYLRTHPYIPERIAMINKEITGRLGFKDYLNLTGNER